MRDSRCANRYEHCCFPTVRSDPSVSGQRPRCTLCAQLRSVAQSGVRIDQLRVWHALPAKNEWSKTNTQVNGSQISRTPKTGQQQYEKSRDSHHLSWDTTESSPGRTLYFVSQYTVGSPVRKYDPKTSPATWTAVHRPYFRSISILLHLTLNYCTVFLQTTASLTLRHEYRNADISPATSFTHL